MTTLAGLDVAQPQTIVKEREKREKNKGSGEKKEEELKTNPIFIPNTWHLIPSSCSKRQGDVLAQCNERKVASARFSYH